MTKFYEPTTVEEAVRVLAEHGAAARLVAGGTDVVVNLNNGSAEPPEVLLGVGRIAGLRDLDVGGAAVTLGAAVTFGELLFSETLRKALPALSTVAGKIAGPQIRNMATIGGNIGNASPGGDMLNPLLALGATVELARSDGDHVAFREVDLADYFTGPGQSVREPTELLTKIHVDLPPAGYRYAHEKFGRRPSMECAVLAVGVGAVVDGQGRLSQVRVVYSAVAPTPLLGTKTAALLEGQTVTPDLLEAVAREARSEVQPIDDIRGSAEYRRELTGVLVQRAVRRLTVPEAAEPISIWPPFEDGGHCCGRDHEHGATTPSAAVGETTRTITFSLNGQRVTVAVSALTPLIDVIRDHAGLLGTKLGCGEGECGTCTVVLDGVTVNSCLRLAATCDGRDVLTIEGLATDGVLDRVQEAFVAHGAVQCGFCTPGMILQAWWVLQQGGDVTPEFAARAIEGNLCRCTGYVKIVEAIVAAADGKTVGTTEVKSS
jgi:xanthine dehydrogenase iron-sulfur cluster and FAD-binding subunit A